MTTEFGTIAHLTQAVEDERSPLQQEMAHTTKIVTLIAGGVGLVFFGLAVALAGVTLAESCIFAIGMIVAFVPAGLLPTVTLALAMGTQRMARRHALIKRLSAVEALGCTTVICTDKTGTLTQNEMTVCGIWLAGRQLTVTGVGYAPEGQLLEQGHPMALPVDADVRQVLVAAGLCNNARVLPHHTLAAQWTILGDPTEAALRVVPALALGAEPAEPDAMDRPPRNRHEHVITWSLNLRARFWLGLPQSLAAMAAFYFMYWTNGYWGQWLDLPASGPLYRAATTMTLASIVATQIGNLFAQRMEYTAVWRLHWGRNRLVWVGIASELTLIVLLLYAPVLQQVFGTAPFPLHNWLFLFAWTPLLLLADEGRKALVRRRARGTLRGM